MNGKNPEVTLVMPCYNEEDSLPVTVPELCDAFGADGVRLELVLVDNGSRDKTGEIIDSLIAAGYPIRKMSLSPNQGYGGGVLAGLNVCETPVVGYLCADGQVSAEDTLIAYRLIKGREDRAITKVRRKFRKDSLKRKIVSIVYNGLMQVLYGGLGAIDVNGNPKIFSLKTLKAMELSSRDWFLDPEFIIKAKHMGLRIIEFDVEGVARRGGASNVRTSTCIEFLKNILLYRFGSALKSWRQRITEAGPYVCHDDSKVTRSVKP
ncbi:MAG TPA: glycosyltransferase family 2 protein [Thermodesulfovibrionales bacterium]|nr:glycosyltransferase family 2 protein [Thermodesulfovibrionales bacterium]